MCVCVHMSIHMDVCLNVDRYMFTASVEVLSLPFSSRLLVAFSNPRTSHAVSLLINGLITSPN